ncbi:MAG: hypothetical protein C0490_13705 [Marivirga sp.]|nr:hypothetical protein [Marivirga sp.]
MREYFSLQGMFRIGCAMCLIGHGAFGLITKPVWCNYFAVFGIDNDLAYQLMPIVGIVDILLGLTLLIYPIRAVAVWLVIWGFTTAMLRPLSGEPVSELLERAGNFGAPIILILLSGPVSWKQNLFGRLGEYKISDIHQLKLIRVALRVIASLLLIGHGWLNLIEKQALVNQYASLGFQDPRSISHVIGCFEVLGALVILFKPIRSLVLVLLLWKMTSELFYPAYELFEWIERGGSYVILLGLWLTLDMNNFPTLNIFPRLFHLSNSLKQQ